MQAPRVRRIAADRRGTPERRTLLGTVVGLALEVRLTAAQFVAERRRGRRARAARVLPLRLGRQAELPVRGQFARRVREVRQLPAEALRLGEVHRVDGEVVALAGGEPTGELRSEEHTSELQSL